MPKKSFFNAESQERFDKESAKRLNEIVGKAIDKVLPIKFENIGSDGYWIMPCDDCARQGNCRYTRACFENVNTGEGLKHFRDKE